MFSDRPGYPHTQVPSTDTSIDYSQNQPAQNPFGAVQRAPPAPSAHPQVSETKHAANLHYYLKYQMIASAIYGALNVLNALKGASDPGGLLFSGLFAFLHLRVAFDCNKALKTPLDSSANLEVYEKAVKRAHCLTKCCAIFTGILITLGFLGMICIIASDYPEESKGMIIAGIINGIVSVALIVQLPFTILFCLKKKRVEPAMEHFRQKFGVGGGTSQGRPIAIYTPN